jgi:hypothetical protein
MKNRKLEKKKKRERFLRRRKHAKQKPLEVLVDASHADTLEKINRNLEILKALEDDFVKEQEIRLAAQENADGNIKQALRDRMKQIINEQQKKIEENTQN